MQTSTGKDYAVGGVITAGILVLVALVFIVMVAAH
jgi:hypothetical protein